VIETPKLTEIARCGQLHACAELYVNIFSAAPWNEQWTLETARMRLQDIFETPGFMGYLSYEMGSVAGFVMGNVEIYQQQRHCYIREICVHPVYQHQGIGSQLMQTIEKRCHAAGLDCIYLLTMRESPAEQFYRKLGFYTSQKMILMSKRVENYKNLT
jgi:ribosomal protein S18 acetylase RimI-like enzyme